MTAKHSAARVALAAVLVATTMLAGCRRETPAYDSYPMKLGMEHPETAINR